MTLFSLNNMLNQAPASAGGAVARAARKITDFTRQGVKVGTFASSMLCTAFVSSGISQTAVADTEPNTLITNTANVSYKHLGVDQTSEGTVSFITARNSDGSGTPSVITLMHNNSDFSAREEAIEKAKESRDSSNTNEEITSRSLRNNRSAFIRSTGAENGSFPVRQGECANDASLTSFTTQEEPTTSDGRDVPMPAQVNLRSDEYFKIGDTIYIHLQDLDQNEDPTQVEDILVTISAENGADKETIRLWETENSSGTFTGYIPSVHMDNVSPNHYDCQLSVRNDSEMQASYVDKRDSVDISMSRALFDPSSIVFDSSAGTGVDGIEVTLIDTATGLPAVVLGDDGASTFPNPMITGESQSDSSGRVYNFPQGGFRFPVIASGDYRVQLGDSVFYDFPSQRSDDIINQLPNGPFLLSAASRGLDFNVTGSTFQIDVPIDPKDNSVLLQKSGHKTKAGIGEYVRYTIDIQNAEVPGTNVIIHDKLPRGFRYEKGSAKLDGNEVADPVISDDGRLLSFTIANMEIETNYSLSYVTHIGVSTPMGMAQNSAWLEDDHLVGNQTQHSIEILDDLFSADARLFGRVYLGTCGTEENQDELEAAEQYGEGVEGVRIYLENGTYVVTDEDGLWHIEGQQPGTHVVQLDTDSLPPYLDLLACENKGFHTGRAYSQFVDLQPGSFWRTDFVVKLKPPAQGAVTQHLSSHIRPLTAEEKQSDPMMANSPVSQKLSYQLDTYGTEVILKKLRALIMLPEGTRYIAGSARFDGKAIAEPKKYDEQTLLFTLNDPGKDWQHQLHLDAVITPDAVAGELTTRSVVMFNSPAKNNQRTPVAHTTALLSLVPANNIAHKPEQPPQFSSFSRELNEKDKAEMKHVINSLKGLENLQIEVSGHTDDMLIAKRSRHIFANNQDLSIARARSVANYIMEQLNLSPEQVTITGHGANKPIAPNVNNNNRAKNRRVEVKILGGKSAMKMELAESGEHMAVTTGIAPGGFDWPVEATAAIQSVNTLTMPEFDKSWLAEQDAELKWVWPVEDFLPNIPSTKVAIKHPTSGKIQLSLNGEAVSELNRSGKEQNKASNNAVSLWSGVDLKEGNNHFVAKLLDKNDIVVGETEFHLHYSGSPVRAELLPEKSKATADGISAPVIAVRLTDKEGFPVRQGLQGEFSVSPPYVALDPNKDQVAINRNNFTPTFEVQEDGIAYLTLEPTTQAGEAVINFPFVNGIEEEVRLWLKPQSRDWMLIALGEGTIGYQDISGHVDNAEANGQNNELWTDGRVALFAKGQIKGEWLITAAYDSAKGKTTPFEKLLDPNKYYTLYGDNSQQKLDASMEGKLYLRVEKERFYTVFGDYSTDLNKTELSTYLRKFHGIQSVFQGDIVSFNVFATESTQRFARDEIQGDGTSGLYRLSNQNLIENTESIVIQVRDRFRSEVIIEETELAKNSDYVIDYVDGTIFFKSPVRSTDDDFNPRYIVATYETEQSNNDNITYGGRAAVHVLDKALEVGATVIEEDQGLQTQRLQGMDMRLQVTDSLEIKSEVARTETDYQSNSNDEAHASLVSMDYRGEQLQTKAYVQRRTAGFGLGQLNASENDTQKAAVEGTYYFTSQSYLESLASDQTSLSTDARQQMVEARYNQEYSLGRYRLGARSSSVTDDSGDVKLNQQLLAGHSMALLEGSLLLNVDGEFNLKRDEEQYDLVRIGSDYRIANEVTLFGIHENSWDKHAPMRSTIGLRTTPWQGAQASNSVEQQQSKDGTRLFAVNGLNQEVNVTESWQLSFSFDQSKDLENSILEETASTQEDFYSTSFGWGYRSVEWQWTNRLEYRDSDAGHKWNAVSGLFHPVSAGLALGVNGEYRLEDQQSTLNKYRQLEFDIGLRPLHDGIAWLNQTKYILDEQFNSTSETISRRTVNNTHLNYMWKYSQISAQYGLKYVTDQIDGTRYNGFVDLIGAEYRRHLNMRWDIGVHGRRLHDYEHGDSLRNLGMSIGYTPRANTWVSFGYNFDGFVDTDFSDAAYTAQGLYLKLRVKADQDSLRQMKGYFE